MPTFDTVADGSLIRTDDFLVSDDTTGPQGGVQFAALPDGGFIAVWRDDAHGVQGRFFDADGNPTGPEFPIDAGVDYDPSVAVLSDGNIVVTWIPQLSGSPQIYEVHARIIDATGLPVSSELTVNTYSGSTIAGSHVVPLADGGFVVAWDLYYGGPGDVRAQIFAADGSKVGGEISALPPVQSVAGGSSIAALTGGGFVVTWNSQDPVQGGGPYDPTVHAQLFDASGAKIGGILTVNSYAPGTQGAASVTALPDGGFVVTWTDVSMPSPDPAHDGIWFQQFDSTGARVGSEVHVVSAWDTVREPSIEVIPGTGFLVVWQQSDVSTANLHAQLYDFNGQPVGTQFGLGGDAAGMQSGQDLALLADGQIIVGWTNQNAPNDLDPRAQFLFPLIHGTNAADVLVGTSHRDFLSGGAGDDQIDGGPSADTMIGGTGNDTYTVDNAGDVIVENPGEGTDTVNASASHTLEAEVENLTLTGSGAINGTGNALNNVITGNSGDNVIDGGAGNDTLDGAGGTDTASYASAAAGVTVNLALATPQNTVGAGTDTLSNFENLTGSAFADTLTGDGNANVIEGGAGNDTLSGGAGIDTLTYAGAASGITINLGLATAQNTVGAGSDTVSNFENLIGSAFNDTLTGNSGANLLTGLGGNDSLDGAGGDDTLDGGAGSDTASYAAAASAVTVNLSLAGAQNTGGAGIDTLVGIENLSGSGFNDTLTGDSANNILNGGAGNDALNGGAGIDTASYAGASSGVTVSLALAAAQNTVGAGTDTLSNFENLLGSSFNDTLTGDGNANVIEGGAGNDVLNGGAGTDTVSYAGAGSAVTVNLGLAGAQNTVGAGSDTLSNFENILGSAFNDTLTGNAGNNVIEGGAGNDTLNGGAGIDTVSYASAAAAVTVDLHAFSGGGGSAGSDSLSNFENVLGSVFADTLSGNESANALDGGAGDDFILPGLGNDTMTGGAGADRFFGARDELNGDTITDFTIGDKLTIADVMLANFSFSLNGNVLTYTGGTLTFGAPLVGTLVAAAGANGAGVVLSLTPGTEGDDVLVGTAQADELNGLGGNDTISGLGGSDTLIGGSGNDIFKGTASELNGDTITDFAPGDTIVITDATFGSFGFNLVGNTLVYTGGALTLQGPLTGELVAAAAPGGGVQFTLEPNETLNGTEQADNIDGHGGNDTINGLGGNDNLLGGSGADVVNGGSGDDNIGSDQTDALGFFTDTALDHDILSGGDGDDWIWAGYGDDVDGGQGTDRLTYSFAGLDHGVTVSTTDIISGQPHAYAGGTIQNVEYLIGIDGTNYADTITVSAPNNSVGVHGGDGDDLIIAAPGTFIVGADGGAGDDRLVSGAFADDFWGGTGSDTIDYRNAASGVTVTLANPGQQGTGSDGDTMREVENIVGSAFNDTLTGANPDNVLEGGAGNDTIDGGNGYDTASYASAASAVTVNLALFGAQNTLGAGIDTLLNIENASGSAFNDTLLGNAAVNVLSGLAGNDSLDGGAGADTLIGGLGDDHFYIDNASDAIVEAAGEGDDAAFVLGTYTLAQGVSVETLYALNQSGTEPLVLTGNEYGQSLYGNLGDNYLNGGQGADFLVGLAGNDNLLGGTGADHMQGGTGNDVYYVDEAGDLITELAGEGDNDILVATASYTLADGVSVETMSAEQNSAAINLTGNELAQSLYGNAGDNILTGGGGADYMVGGAGNDKYYVDTSDFIGESVGGGDDWIFVATSYTLREGNEIETLVALNQDSTDPVNFSGNEFGQSLYGSQGANQLDGGGGNDFLVGLGGNDFLIGGAGNDNLQGGTGNDLYYVDGGDQIFEAANEGDDLAVAFASFTLGAGQSVETLSANEGSGAINLTGNALAQSIYGNSAANVLTSGGGADSLTGGAGNDTFVLTNAAGVATVTDYTAGDVVDIRQFLSVANGTNVVGSGYVRIVGTQLQVDANGGGDAFVTVGNVSGSGNVTIRYQSGGSPTDLSVARSAGQEAAVVSKLAFDEGPAHAPLLDGWHAGAGLHDSFGLDPIAPHFDIHGLI